MEDNRNEHWLIRIGDGKHFINSSKFNIWGIDSKKKSNTNKFIKESKENDKLWFITSNSQGKAIAVATFLRLQKREIGPLISLSLTNEELGWNLSDGNWDYEVHYKDLYNLSNLDILTRIQSARSIRRYSDNIDKIKFKLYEEYKNIVKYSKVNQNFI